MKLVANGINKCFFRDILPEDETIDHVFAAIAYGSDKKKEFIEQCVKHGYKLNIWIRCDHTAPFDSGLLRCILSNSKNNISCRLIWNKLHSKIIWWQGYGVYIGSANLTDNGWRNNIEVGLFLTHEEIESNQLAIELKKFFSGLENEDSEPLNEAIIDKIEKLSKGRKPHLKEMERDAKDLKSCFRTTTKRPKRISPKYQEWQKNQKFLEEIAEQIEGYRPKWLDKKFPPCWQADQFLYAYYRYKVKEEGCKKFHDRNKDNRQVALEEAMQWWKKLDEAPTKPPYSEKENLENADKYIKKRLSSKNSILKLKDEEIEEIMHYTHASRTHFSRQGKDVKEFINQTNDDGQRIHELWSYVLYGGEEEKLWERLFEVIKGKRKILHYGESSWFEVVGWARPEIVAPCNNITKNALYALGYPVKVKSKKNGKKKKK